MCKEDCSSATQYLSIVNDHLSEYEEKKTADETNNTHTDTAIVI